MVYESFKDLARRTASGKVLCDKVFHIEFQLKYDAYQRGLVSMIYSFFNKFSSGAAAKS